MEWAEMSMCNCKDPEWLGPCPTHGIDPIGSTMEPLNFEVEAIKRLRLKPGDVILLRHPGNISEQMHRNLKESIEAFLESCNLKNRVMLLEEGLDLEILHCEDDNEQNQKGGLTWEL